MWKKIGSFSVDSGTFLISDPCYLQDKKHISKIDKACLEMLEENKSSICARFEMGHEGLAVIANTGIGDGYFDVFERIKKDGSKEIKIIFR